MVDPAHGGLDDSYTPEDDSQEAHSVFSEEGTTRRSDNGVKCCYFSHTFSWLILKSAFWPALYLSWSFRWRNQSRAQSCPLWHCPSTGACRLLWVSTAPHWTVLTGRLLQATTPPLQFPGTITTPLWEDTMNTAEGPHQKHTPVWAGAHTWMNVTGNKK